jgi:uncharacterized protein
VPATTRNLHAIDIFIRSGATSVLPNAFVCVWSTARGDRRPDSDIDLLAAFDDTRRISILDVAGIERQISQLLGGTVDLVEEGTLKPRVRKNVEAEALRAF